jgi:hypothetical protein
LAGYLKPLLPQEVAIPAILELDRFWWTDKELRAMKGRWEKKILAALLSFATVNFQKRRFEHNGEDYELDAAYSTADCIKIGVDVKRIESKRDIHKRSDEIINKANHFKSAYPEGLFYVVVYYPFPTQHGNLRSRLDSGNIDGLYMASESDSSIDTAVRFLLDAAGVLRKHSEDEDEY